MSKVLSIITVNLNNAKGLEKTIKSVISQTLNNYQFIVIDGVSTDESVEIIKKYADKIDYWISEPDTGVFNAMNKGIKQSIGKYCHFLNSGDYYASDDVLEKVFRNKTYDAPYINGHQINDFGNESNRASNPGRALTLYDFYKGTIKHQATFIKRSLFDKYGLYDESLRIVADWKFFLQTIALHNEQPVFVDIDIAIFEWFGLSTDEKQKQKHDAEKQKVFDELLPKPVQEDYKHLSDLNNYTYIAETMKNSKLFSSIVRALVKIFK